MLFLGSIYINVAMIIIWLTTVIFLLVIYYIQFTFRRRKFEEIIDKFPGPPVIPAFGNYQISTVTAESKKINHIRIFNKYVNYFLR